jgi:2-C-methyl-D-erythritol 4-phosphate cytidylyltransferase
VICAALVTAGGIGTRMQNRMPKQFLELQGVPILARSIMAFDNHPLINRIVVTAPKGHESKVQSLIVRTYRLKKVTKIVTGGSTRQESVYNGLVHLVESDIIAIHDGVRPLVSAEVITATILAAQSSGASIAGIPVKETVKKQDGPILETVPRSNLWMAHTPQTFRTSLIVEAHQKSIQDGFFGTDDASLVERLGHPITIVEDTLYNVKITKPSDLKLANIYLDELEG